MEDWLNIKTEYITTDTSYKTLGKKYGISEFRIQKIGNAEKWALQKRQYIISHYDARAICPFYKYDDNVDVKTFQRVICEGLVPDSTITLWFNDKRDRNIQVKTFCCEWFDRCEIYRMLMDSKYPDE